MMIGSERVSGRARSRRHSSMPERPGSIQSSTTRSGTLSFSRDVGLVAARHGIDLVALRFEIVAQQQRQRLFVLDDQDACGLPVHRLRLNHLCAGIGAKAGGVALRPLVGDRAALDHEIDGLGDVGGMVAHALDVLGAEHQMDAEA